MSDNTYGALIVLLACLLYAVVPPCPQCAAAHAPVPAGVHYDEDRLDFPPRFSPHSGYAVPERDAPPLEWDKSLVQHERLCGCSRQRYIQCQEAP